jgi:hypothetical protein
LLRTWPIFITSKLELLGFLKSDILKLIGLEKWTNWILELHINTKKTLDFALNVVIFFVNVAN